MRIKSPFRDYYDGLAAYDNEPEPLFIRNSITDYSDESCVPHPSIFVIGFCGRLFPVMRTQLPMPFDYNGNPHYIYHYTPASYYATKKYQNKYEEKREKELIDLAFELKSYSWIGAHTDYKPKLLKYFDMFNTPIFIACQVSRQAGIGYIDKVDCAPRLMGWDFARIVPPYEAWRELNIYLSNKANPNPIIPAISNADMIVAKGFNHPDSFRNVKGESGPARKRKKK